MHNRSMIAAVLLIAVLPVCAEAPGPYHTTADMVESYNYVLGTQTFGVRYTFTEDDGLVETAKAIHAMGSNILKIGLDAKYTGELYNLPQDDTIKTVTDLAARQPSFREVLDMPFTYYMLWVYPMAVDGWWDDGLSEMEAEQTYHEVYDLARHLLKTYSGTGKTFYLGHWEGDWHLHPEYDGSKDPSDIMIQGMTDWLNTRQRAIDDAKAQTDHHQVQVFHYTEVCLVDKAMNGGKTLTNSVLPKSMVDFVSYSTYDRLNWGGEGLDVKDIEARLVPALDYIESRLPPKPGIEGKRVFIGEYGFPLQVMGSAGKQDTYCQEVARVSLEWGCPFVLYWAMYCNENKDGEHKGFWMIDKQGEKQPIYDTHQRYYSRAKAFVRQFIDEHGRAPTRLEFQSQAAALLVGE